MSSDQEVADIAKKRRYDNRYNSTRFRVYYQTSGALKKDEWRGKKKGYPTLEKAIERIEDITALTFSSSNTHLRARKQLMVLEYSAKYTPEIVWLNSVHGKISRL